MAKALPQCRAGIKDVKVAMPEGRYRPAAIPMANKPSLRVQGPVLKETPINANPKALLAIIMVRLWLRREDTNPDPVRTIKYPSVIIKNSAPAFAWVRFNSISIRGARGAGMIRDTKLRKKIDVRIKTGPN